MNNLPIQTYESVVKQRDALAAENAELKSRVVIVPAKSYVKDMRCNVVRWAKVIDALSDSGVAFVRDDGELIAGSKETPVTDAFTRELMAKGVDMAISHIYKKFEGTGRIGVPVMALEWLAKNIRAGGNDAQ